MRDRDLLALFRHIRFAETRQLADAIIPALFPSYQTLRVRLGKLGRAGLLDRPGRRILPDPYAVASDGRTNGRPQDIWALGQRGAALLDLRGDWKRNNTRLRPVSFPHALGITKVFLTLKLAAFRNLIDLDEWIPENQFRETVIVDGERISMIPDATARIADRRSDRETRTFVEVDNGTAPIERSSFRQSSFGRKTAAYQTYWETEVRPQHGAMVVLTVARTPERATALREATGAKHPYPRNLFWFAAVTDWPITNPERFLYEPMWQTGGGDSRALFG
jgi:hypothetical protein